MKLKRKRSMDTLYWTTVYCAETLIKDLIIIQKGFSKATEK